MGYVDRKLQRVRAKLEREQEVGRQGERGGGSERGTVSQLASSSSSASSSSPPPPPFSSVTFAGSTGDHTSAFLRSLFVPPLDYRPPSSHRIATIPFPYPTHRSTDIGVYEKELARASKLQTGVKSVKAMITKVTEADRVVYLRMPGAVYGGIAVAVNWSSSIPRLTSVRVTCKEEVKPASGGGGGGSEAYIYTETTKEIKYRETLHVPYFSGDGPLFFRFDVPVRCSGVCEWTVEMINRRVKDVSKITLFRYC
uniref:Uncharacterized protein n=1 Tax=Palpitomonas bilix TaxID=652834 RepID=A0A7S3DKY9_9EUKA